MNTRGLAPVESRAGLAAFERLVKIERPRDEGAEPLVPSTYEAYVRVGQSSSNGSLDDAVVKVLASTLAVHTSTPDDCYFVMWEGYAEFSASAAPRVVLPPDRRMLLFAGPLLAVQTLIPVHRAWRYPLRWWTRGDEWRLAADIYSTSVFIGGSADCIDAIARQPELSSTRLEGGAG